MFRQNINGQHNAQRAQHIHQAKGHAQPQHTSLYACAEPLSAALVSVLWLGVAFGWMDVLGSLCIVLTIYILSKQSEQTGSDPD